MQSSARRESLFQIGLDQSKEWVERFSSWRKFSSRESEIWNGEMRSNMMKIILRFLRTLSCENFMTRWSDWVQSFGIVTLFQTPPNDFDANVIRHCSIAISSLMRSTKSYIKSPRLIKLGVQGASTAIKPLAQQFAGFLRCLHSFSSSPRMPWENLMWGKSAVRMNELHSVATLRRLHFFQRSIFILISPTKLSSFEST